MTSDARFDKALDELNDRMLDGRLTKMITGPVTDWATDFDHLEAEWAADPYVIQDDLRQRCPVAHTERFGGAWLPTTFDDVAAISYDTERFSSRAIIMGNFRPPPELAPIGGSPPISSDPPFHHDARKLLLQAFTKRNVEKLEAATRAFCHAQIDAFDGESLVDASRQYAQHIPMRVISDLLGFPPEDGPQFAEFVENALEGINAPLEEQLVRGQKLGEYILGQINDHLTSPRDDLTSYLLDAELYGQKLDPFHVAGTMVLLLIAGIDTTWSAIGSSLWHLAKTPADRERLIAEPGLMPTAIEEFLRAFAPVTMAREVMGEATISGCPIKPGNMVLLSFPAANRDPAVFPDADKVVIDRKENRHAAFGLGIHRCVGSNLARMEMTVAIEEWLKRIPDFRLDPAGRVAWSEGTVRGPRRLPVLFGKA
jgi:hypothetical protein